MEDVLPLALLHATGCYDYIGEILRYSALQFSQIRNQMRGDVFIFYNDNFVTVLPSMELKLPLVTIQIGK